MALDLESSSADRSRVLGPGMVLRPRAERRQTFVAQHLAHHRSPESAADPHSAALGFWHSHVGWILASHKLSVAPPRRIVEDRMVGWFERYHAAPALLGLALPALLGGTLGPLWYAAASHFSFEHAIEGLLWGGFVRLALGHHSVFAAASLSHLWGSRSFPTADTSRNSPFLLNLVQLGDGYHNQHHAIPRSATFAARRGQVDVVGLLIQVLEHLGLARKVVWPGRQDWARVKAKLAREQAAVRVCGHDPTVCGHLHGCASIRTEQRRQAHSGPSTPRASARAPRHGLCNRPSAAIE